MDLRNVFGKILYGGAFMVILPLVLIFWAKFLEDSIALPIILSYTEGFVLVVVGFLIAALGMINLWVYGKGLPMNAYPPKTYVNKGVYHLLPHPIYFGACMLSFGISTITNSASGFWLVSPVLVLACISLVLGYEKEDMERRFGKISQQHLFSFPENNKNKPSYWDRISVFVLVFFPSFLICKTGNFLSNSEKHFLGYIQDFKSIDNFQWFLLIYYIPYLLGIGLPFIIGQKKELRALMLSLLYVIGLGWFIQVFVPLKFVSSIFSFDSVFQYKSYNGLLPYQYLAQSLIILTFYGIVFKKIRKAVLLITLLFAVGCFVINVCKIGDLVIGVLLFLASTKRSEIWKAILGVCEKMANSWKAWYFGSIRVINHGFYAGLSTFISILIVGVILDESYFIAVLVVTLFSIFGAGAWAQIVEGASGLSRPFGYYGSIIGGILGALVVSLVSEGEFIVIIAAFAICSPWTQAIGRLRCFIQGCCHGKRVSPEYGIRHYNEKSRVCTLSKMKGESLHPTPLYSIISNVIVGIVLLKLWSVGTSLPLIAGLYFILTNLYRFVEESYRGEPQTPIWKGLRLYQWVAIGGMFFGIILTFVPSPRLYLQANYYPEIFVLALVLGFLAFFAMGVDFPNSTKRFSKLAQ